MQQENSKDNKDNTEAVATTRWILAVGMGGLLLFIILSYAWFGLTSNASKPPTTVTVIAANVSTATVAVASTASELVATLTVLSLTAGNSILAVTATPFVVATELPTDIPTLLATDTPLPTNTPTLLPTDTALPTATPTIAATPTDTPLPSVQLPLLAAQTFDQLQSLHFVIEIRAGKVSLFTGADLKRAEGDLTRNGRFQAAVIAHTFVGDISVHTIGVDNDQYLTNPIGGSWSKLGAGQNFNLSVLFDQKNGIGGLTRQLQNVKIIGNDTIDNVTCVHLMGTLPGSAVGPITIGTLGHNPVTLDVWVGRDDNLIRQIYLKETTTNGAFWAINLSKFNETVNIQRPI